MGYLENILPKYLARHGVDPHVVAMDLPPYYWMEGFNETYGQFSDPLHPGSVETLSGYTVHVLGHKKIAGYMRMVGLWEKLRSLRPDIVQLMKPIGWTALDSALYQPLLGYKLFTGCHTTASVFPLATRRAPWWDSERLKCLLTRTSVGSVVSLFTEKCHAATSDCGDVASRFFGVSQRKIELAPLGVDTELFSYPPSEAERQAALAQRERLGFQAGELVCIYTGRFSEDKNPLLLAQAMDRLRRAGEPFRGLFVGNGVQAQRIAGCAGCVLHPFVPVQQLPEFFRASDIAVWPNQESMSMLDAAASGLPIVVNDGIVATERVEGNGLTYKRNDLDDLVRVLRQLRDQRLRKRLGGFGAEKVRRQFSWDAVAVRRIADYRAALGARGNGISSAPENGSPAERKVSETTTV